MLDLQYVYLAGNGILFIIWILLFLLRKDVRKEMITISLIFGILGPIVEYIHLQDWWKPETITGTAIGIEDFLFGFFIAGIAAVIYEEVFMKKLKTRRANRKQKERRNFRLVSILALTTVIFFGGFYFLDLNTFIGGIISLSIPLIVIYVLRNDLIIESLISGGLLVIVMVFGYTILNVLSPGWIEAFWLFQNLPKMMILNIPLEEYIWYFLAGALIGPLYEFWQEAKVVDNS